MNKSVQLIPLPDFQLKDPHRRNLYNNWRSKLRSAVAKIILEQDRFDDMMKRGDSPPDGYWEEEHRLRKVYTTYLRLIYEEFPEAFPPNFKLEI